MARNSTLRPPDFGVRYHKSVNKPVPHRESPESLPLAVIQRIQAACDNLVKRVTRRHVPPVTCSAGCCFCCRQPVFLTPLEGLAIRELLHSQRRTQVVHAQRQAYLEAVRSRPGGSRALETVRRSLSGEGPPPTPEQRLAVYGPACLFLRDGLCSIYPARPLMCREHISFDDVAKCEHDEPFFGLEKPRFDEVSAYLTRNVATPRDQWFGVWDYEKAAALGDKMPSVREKDLREILQWKTG